MGHALSLLLLLLFLQLEASRVCPTQVCLWHRLAHSLCRHGIQQSLDCQEPRQDTVSSHNHFEVLISVARFSSLSFFLSSTHLSPGFGRQRASRALTLYYTQLALTQAFTPIRFVFGQVGFSVVNMLALTGTVGYWVAELKDVNETAFYLNLPYLAWSAFASALSVRTWWINGGESQIKGLWGDAKNKADKAKK